MEWIKAVRPLNGLVLALLTILGFKITGTKNLVDALPFSLVEFIIYSATIVWNDFCDRETDYKKGKVFAYYHEVYFFHYSLIWWAISLFACLWVLEVYGFWSCFQATGFVVIGFAYTWLQRNAFLKNVAVVICVSSVLLLPLTQGYHPTTKWWYLLICSSLINFGREIIKDAEDMQIDISKGTLPKFFGAKKAIIIASFCIITGAALAIKGLGISGIFLFFFSYLGSKLALKGKYTESSLVLKIAFIIFVLSLFVWA